MQTDERKSNDERTRKENTEIAIEKMRTKDIKQLKTLEELMKEER